MVAIELDDDADVYVYVAPFCYIESSLKHRWYWYVLFFVEVVSKTGWHYRTDDNIMHKDICRYVDRSF